MGYYSIFKIIRQILKDLLSYKVFKKLLFIILLAIVTVFLLHNSGYCATDNPYYFYVPNDTSRYYDLTPLKDYYFLFGCYKEDRYGVRFNLVVSDKPFTIRTNNNGTFGFVNANGGLFSWGQGSALFSQMQQIINESIPQFSNVPNVR